MRAPRVLIPASLLVLVCALAGCGSPAAPNPAATPTFTAVPADGSSSPSPAPSARKIAIPDDCRELLSDAVLTELGDTPLNDPAFGPTGLLDDGSLLCVWGDPGADTTSLTTTVSRENRGPALELLNDLADKEGLTCFTPDKGTRCEKSWQNDTYPVTDGRTLFWRDDVLIDTQYSNLAPAGYTSSIIEKLFD